MELVGRVRAGAGLGAPRMDNQHVMELITASVGFRPVPGTLNVILEQPFDRSRATDYMSASTLSPTWQDEVGQAGYWITPIVVAGRYRAAAIQADEPGYPPEQIELVCDVRLRDALALSDGDTVTISLDERVRTPPDLRVPHPAPGERWIVGAVIHDGAGRIFFQRRSETRGLFPGAWDLVGGHLEPGEAILECLAREVREETGWSVERIVADLGTLTWTGDDGLARHEIDYLVEVAGDLDRPDIETALHLDPRWVNRDTALQLLDGSHPSDALVRQVVERAFAMLAQT